MANMIGVSVDNLDESLEVRFVGSEQKHRLKKSLNRVIEDQINALEQQLNTHQKTTAPKAETAQATKIETPAQPVASVENKLDEEFVGEKRVELKRMIEVIGDRVQDIRNLQSDPKTKSTWMDRADVQESIDQAYEDAEKLRKMLGNSSPDTALNQLANSATLRPMVLEAVAEGLSLREEMLRARESKGALVRLQVVEGGLKNIEKAGGAHIATSKEHRQVIGGLRGAYARNKKLMNAALATMFAVGSGGLVSRYVERAQAAELSAAELESARQKELSIEQSVPAKATDLVTDKVLKDANINPDIRATVINAVQKALDKAPEKGRSFAAEVRIARKSGNQDLIQEAMNQLFKNNSLNSDSLAEWLKNRRS